MCSIIDAAWFAEMASTIMVRTHEKMALHYSICAYSGCGKHIPCLNPVNHQFLGRFSSCILVLLEGRDEMMAGFSPNRLTNSAPLNRNRKATRIGETMPVCRCRPCIQNARHGKEDANESRRRWNAGGLKTRSLELPTISPSPSQPPSW